jgi:hypothetical protein
MDILNHFHYYYFSHLLEFQVTLSSEMCCSIVLSFRNFTWCIFPTSFSCWKIKYCSNREKKGKEGKEEEMQVEPHCSILNGEGREDEESV